MNVWAAIFLLCTQQGCITAGSPLFKTEEECQYATEVYGLNHVAGKFTDHVILTWMCVSFGDIENDV